MVIGILIKTKEEQKGFPMGSMRNLRPSSQPSSKLLNNNSKIRDRDVSERIFGFHDCRQMALGVKTDGQAQSARNIVQSSSINDHL
jgi:hypothetical protein